MTAGSSGCCSVKIICKETDWLNKTDIKHLQSQFTDAEKFVQDAKLKNMTVCVTLCEQTLMMVHFWGRADTGRLTDPVKWVQVSQGGGVGSLVNGALFRVASPEVKFELFMFDLYTQTVQHIHRISTVNRHNVLEWLTNRCIVRISWRINGCGSATEIKKNTDTALIQESHIMEDKRRGNVKNTSSTTSIKMRFTTIKQHIERDVN